MELSQEEKKLQDLVKPLRDEINLLRNEINLLYKEINNLKNNNYVNTLTTKCDSCGCHPNITYSTEKGVFCQDCYLARNNTTKYKI